jgi:hypothetical protein
MTFEDKYSRTCDLIRLLPECRTHEDLLQRMQDLGWDLSLRQLDRDISMLIGIGIDVQRKKPGYHVTVTEDFRALVP